MMGSPQDARFPEDTTRRAAEFLEIESFGVPSLHAHRTTPAGRVRSEAWESIYRIETASAELFGIFAEPAPGIRRSDCCILYLNAGGVRHTGPNRMWVESARRWAMQGVPSLRLDVRGIGESDGEEFLAIPSLYQERQLIEIDHAIASLRRNIGIKRFIAVGLCSGACWGFHAAARIEDVRGAILLNPSLLYWDAGADRRRMLRMAGGFKGWIEYVRLLRSGIERGDIERAARRIFERLGRKRRGGAHLQLGFKNMAEAWSTFERSRKRVTLVFREGEPLLTELQTRRQLPPEKNSMVRCVRVPNGGHTLRPLWAQKLVHEVIDTELAVMTVAAVDASAERQPRDPGFSSETVHA